MTKKNGAMAGILGGLVASIIGIILFWPGLYWIIGLVNHAQGESAPRYTPIYQAIGALFLLIPATIGTILIIITWYFFGKKQSEFQNKRELDKTHIFLSWMAWSVSVPILLSIVILIPDVASVIKRGRLTPQNIRDTISLLKWPVTWWLLGGLVSGFTSAIYTIVKWEKSKVKNRKH